MTLILVGYMGSGKSSVGHNLAKILDYEYLDLDEYIKEKEDQSILDLFKSKGEIHFRRLESNYLNEILNKENSIVSLGGGTPCYGNNMEAINSSECISIYLRASVKTLTNRIYPERQQRPLVAHLEEVENLQEYVGKHLFERSQFYENADLTIDTDDLTIEQVAGNIVARLF